MRRFYGSLAFVAVLALSTPIFAAPLGTAGALSKKHEAKFPLADARAKALALVPGGTLVSEELELEGKRWIYSFEIKPKGEKGKLIKEVNIDADTGVVVSVETEQD
jgi:uncharacterized membrane protein YkoI